LRREHHRHEEFDLVGEVELDLRLGHLAIEGFDHPQGALPLLRPRATAPGRGALCRRAHGPSIAERIRLCSRTMRTIDLRSDTVTRPTPAMREAMARAEVAEDVYGEDPTVRALEERVASLLGKECAVFVPSGTMANQIAVGAQAGPGQEVICDAGAHVVAYEGGAMAALWGAQPRTVEGERGILRPEAIEPAIQTGGDHHLPRTALIAIENTHNRGGGSVWPLDRLDAVFDL